MADASVPEGFKVCSGLTCNGELRPRAEFGRDKRSRDGLRHICRRCRKACREKLIIAGVCADGCGRPARLGKTRCQECSNKYYWARTRKYSYADEEWGKQAWVLQNGLCDVCQKPPADGERLAVDHDHKTKNPRALIHRYPCNVLVGFLENFPGLDALARDYLSRHQSSTRAPADGESSST